MIEEGDRLLIGVSGGADSLALLDLLDTPMIFIPQFSFIAVNIDMGSILNINPIMRWKNIFRNTTTVM